MTAVLHPPEPDEQSMACIPDLFTDQATRTPDAIALVEGRRTWTYGQLEASTNQLAHALQQRGVGPEVVVGCYLPSPAQLVRHLLAILKAGGAYLLLDQQLPAARLRYMLTDAEAALVIHDGVLPALVSAGVEDAVSIERLAAEAAHAPTTPVICGVHPDNAAYLAYTSGSTGRPKGVVITHGGTVAHARAFKKMFALSPADRVPLMAPAGFDVATEEIVPALLAGCRVIASTPVQDDMAALTHEIRSRNYTILNFPASLWQRWTEHLHYSGQAVPPTVRLLITGSESIHTRTLHEWLQLPGARQVQWVAAYGTTEATVTSSVYLDAAEDDLSREPLVPIGKPIPGTDFHVLDQDGQPVPDGTVGELVIGGLGVARGYRNLPAITRQAFIRDSFSGRPGARLYRTGDLVWRRPDGNLSWIGRRDSQLKLHGLRIEPGEIEAVLRTYPGISSAAVTLRRNDDGRDELAAYVTPRTGHGLDVAALTEHARVRLHPLMMPTRVEVLAALPLTVTGKLDRHALHDKPADAAVFTSAASRSGSPSG